MSSRCDISVLSNLSIICQINFFGKGGCVLKLFLASFIISIVTLHAGSYGVCETERVDMQKAKESIETILLNEPANVACMLQLANIHLKQGKIAKGFEILVDAYSIDPHLVQNSPVAAVLPFALKVSNLKRQALKTNDKEMWNKLGDGYFEMGIFNEAAAMYKNSLLSDGAQHDIRLKLSLAHQKNCQTYSALEELKRILNEDTKHLYANYYMGKILMYDVKNSDEAKRYFVQCKQTLLQSKGMFGYMEYTNLLSDIGKELGE